MHPVATYASYTNGAVPPSVPPASTPPPPPPPVAAAAVFPAVGLGSTALLRERYRRKQSIGLGITQAIIGTLCIVFNAVSLGFYDGVQTSSVGYVGHGFWIGMLFIITGTIGLAAGKSRTRCTITAFMTMCIISATFTIVILSLGVAGAVAASQGGGYNCVAPYGFNYYYPYYYQPPCYAFKVVVAMETCMAVAGFFEAIVAIWGAVICCQSGICCCSGPRHAMVLPVNYYPSNGHVMYLTHAQGLQVIYAPPSNMTYSQGTVIPPLSYQTSFSQPAWSRPHQLTVAGATGATVAPNSASPPPPYASNPHLQQPTDYLQKY